LTLGLASVPGTIGFEFFSGSDCASGHLSGLFSTATAVGSSWVTIAPFGGAGNGGAHSFKFEASFTSSLGFVVEVDRAFLGPPVDIFAEGYETGELCRFSDAFQ